MTERRGLRATVVLSAVLLTAACGSTYAQGRPNYPNYPYPDARGGPRGGYADPAYSQGFDDGYRQGLDAARDGDRYNVRRERWYRSADRGYNRRYGPREAWRRVYRDGFAAGYDRGYREARYRSNDRYRRRPW